jgi:WD40 repeat protein
MKLFEGGSLAQQAAGLKSDPRAAARLVASVARAVHHAHQRGILHRDLKPANILLDEQGQPHVTDFGLAKRVEGAAELTQSGAVLGTPSYMAPEQARGDKGLSVAADVYALGAILYECLTGRPPFRGESPVDTLLAVLEREPPRLRQVEPSVPRDLETICLKCLHKAPGQRYHGAAELADDLEHWLNGEPIRARPVGSLERAVKWARRQPAVAALLAVVVVVAAAGLGGVMWKYRDAERQKEVAQRQEAAAVAQGERAEKEELEARRQLERSRRSLYTAQLMRVAAVWDRDPGLARTLLDDDEVCPLPLCDFSWGVYYHLWRSWGRRRVPGFAYCLAWGPDGRTLALGGYREIRLVDVASGQKRSIPTTDDTPLLRLAFSRDGNRLVSSDLQTLRVGDVETGQALLAPWKEPAASVRAVAMAPDGKSVAFSIGVHHPKATVEKRWSDGRLKLWDLTTGKVRTLIERPGTGLISLRFSPDGKTLAAGETHVDHVLLLDLPSGKTRGTIFNRLGWIQVLAYSGDGKLLAYSGDAQTIWVCDPSTGQRLRALQGHSAGVYGLDLSSDGTLLASSSADRTVRLWDVGSGRQRAVLRCPDGVTSVALAPHGRALAVLGDSQVALWDLFPQPRSVPLQRQPRGALALAPDGRALAAGDSAGNVKLWDTALGFPWCTLGRQSLDCVAFAPNGTQVAGGGGGKVRVWDVATRQERGMFVCPTGRVGAVAFSPDGRSVAAGERGAVRVWDLGVRPPRGQVLGKHGGAVNTLAFRPDSRMQFSGSGQLDEKTGKTVRGEMKMWDMADREIRWTQTGHDETVACLAVSPNSALLASGSADRTVCVWNAGGGRGYTMCCAGTLGRSRTSCSRATGCWSRQRPRPAEAE